MNTAELRKLFIDYFVERGHLLVPSASLVPTSDPTVLLTTAGMQQFKPYFMGLAEPPESRLVSVQKCFRTSDIDKVGLTARHCTFFEMLGNFSIGDYFKEGAIRFAWEFSVQHLGFDPGRLWVSYFKGDKSIDADEEAVSLWREVGVPDERMVGLPRSDNFWGPVGDSGPCGPCSELYYDRGPDVGCGAPECKPGCDCDRFVEFWNLVFTGYNMDETQKLTPLPAHNIDTGMGLERIAALKAGASSVFMVDSFAPLIELGEELSGKRFGEDEKADVGLRVVADHSRAVAFLVADGVNPSNEGRGYVLRRIIRRAARFSRSLGIEAPFLAALAGRVVDMLGGEYQELRERKSSILRVAKAEEERFNRTLDQGLKLLDEAIAEAESDGSTVFPGDTAFLLHDTYGFPVEVTREIVQERGLSMDVEGFDEAMGDQKKRARGASKATDAIKQAVVEFARKTARATDFLGYERSDLYTVAENLAELPDGRVAVTLRESPFYAEGGGQTADIGVIESETGRLAVEDVQQHGEVQVIVARVTEGTVAAGTRVKAALSLAYRHDVAANHTATHLLHYALRTRLGQDVTQAGSSVRADKLRFDFAYHEPLGPRRLAEVEELVNRRIVEDHPVRTFVTTIEHARDLGAMALFGEKYDDFVRVVEVDDFSRELCGGTHVGSTSELGIFKIVSEGSVGANVRRIEAVTGRSAVAYYRRQDSIVTQANSILRSGDGDVTKGIERLLQRVSDLEAEVKKARSGNASDLTDALVQSAEDRSGVSVAGGMADVGDMDELLGLVDRVRDRLHPAAVVMGAVVQGKGTVVVSTSPGLDAIDAGSIVKETAADFGGGGGGNKTMGRGGGIEPGSVDEAVAAAKRRVLELL